MTSITDQDIGMCDDCGSDTGPRTRQRRVVTIDGATLVYAWVCRPCLAR